MRVMHVTFDMRIGGTEMVIKNIIEGNSDANIEMSIYCIEAPLGPWGEDLKASGTPIAVEERQPGFDSSLINKIRKHIKDNDIDILHCHQYTPWVYGTLAAAFTKTKVIFTEHGRFYPDSSSWKRKLVNPVLHKFTSAVTAISEATKSALEEFEAIPKSDVKVIYNGIKPLDSDNEAKNALKERLKLPDNCIILGTVARFDPIKNQEMMIKAFSKALRDRNNLILLLVGDGELRPTLETIVKEEGISNNVRFTGYIKDPSQFIDLMDVFLLSSLSEGTSMTLLEAMSLSKPCIVTDAGGNPEIIIDQQNGLVTPNGCCSSFSHAIETLSSSPLKLKAMGENGYNIFCEKFSANTMVSHYSSIYFETMEN